MLKQLISTSLVIGLLGAGLACTQAVHAAAMTGDDVARLIASRAYAEVDAGGGLDLSAALSHRINVDGPGSRLSAVSLMASDLGARWSKIYVVTPADSVSGVTTLAQADRFVDNQGVLSTDLSGVQARAMMRIVADSDSATVQISPAVPNTLLDLSVGHARVAWAIAQIAKLTHTHWAAHYVLSPDPDLTAVANNAGVSLTNRPGVELGPITEHVRLHNGKDENALLPNQPTTSTAQANTANSTNGNAGSGANTSTGNGYTNYGYPYTGYSGMYPYGYSNRPQMLPGNNGLIVLP